MQPSQSLATHEWQFTSGGWSQLFFIITLSPLLVAHHPNTEAAFPGVDVCLHQRLVMNY